MGKKNAGVRKLKYQSKFWTWFQRIKGERYAYANHA